MVERDRPQQMPDQVFTNINVGAKSVKFKLDTGAQVNVMPMNHFQNQFPNVKLLTTDHKLYGYSRKSLEVLGESTLPCSHKVTKLPSLGTLEVRKPYTAMVSYQHQVTRECTDTAAPFLQTCSKVGKRGTRSVPLEEINLQKEACHFFGFLMIFFQFLYNYLHIYKSPP